MFQKISKSIIDTIIIATNDKHENNTHHIINVNDFLEDTMDEIC